MVDLDGLRALRRHRVKAAFTASRASPESAEIGQLSLNVRIPTIVTTRSDASRPPVPIDRDQCDGTVRCIF